MYFWCLQLMEIHWNPSIQCLSTCTWYRITYIQRRNARQWSSIRKDYFQDLHGEAMIYFSLLCTFEYVFLNSSWAFLHTALLYHSFIYLLSFNSSVNVNFTLLYTCLKCKSTYKMVPHFKIYSNSYGEKNHMAPVMSVLFS